VIVATVNDAGLKLLVCIDPLVHEGTQTTIAHLREKRLLIDLPENVREYETTS
jgi:hypothetical protein